MHVAILCEYGSVNGGENSILAMIERMDSVQVTVLAPPAGRLADRLDRVGVARFPFSLEDDAGRRLDRPAALERLQQVVRRIDPDLLHANSLAMGRLTGALRPSLSIPTSAHLRDIIRLKQAAIDDLNANDALIAVSRETADAHLRQGLDGSRTHVIYNGIDCEALPPCRNSKTLRRELDLSDSGRLVATIGQITLRKGQDLFVQAAIDSAAELPDVHWLIVGERYSHKPETVAFDEQMRRQVADAGLRGRIHWLGYRGDVLPLLSEIDVLVHPARQEPLGRVLLEAAACGTAIVATSVGGTAEILEHERTGLLIPPDNPPAIVDAVARLIADDCFRISLATSARTSICDRFALGPRTAELTALWRKLVTGHVR
jgi:glycosyltransferase involved in cell wall biosynthesis